MSQQNKPAPPPLPLHTHYKLFGSSNVGDIYPAMRNPPGYEDQHPEDWQPATAEDIARYKANSQSVLANTRYNPDGSTKVQGTGGGSATGGVLVLADDDDAPAVPPAPIAIAIPTAPVPPAPAVIEGAEVAANPSALGFGAPPPPPAQ